MRYRYYHPLTSIYLAAISSLQSCCAT